MTEEPTNYLVKTNFGILYWPGNIINAEQAGPSLEEHVILGHLVPTKEAVNTTLIAKPIIVKPQTPMEEVAAKANAIQQQALAIEADRDQKQADLEKKEAELEDLKAKLAEAEAGKKKAEEEAAELALAKETKEKQNKRNQ